MGARIVGVVEDVEGWEAGIVKRVVEEYGVLRPRACGGRVLGVIVAVEGIDGAGVTTVSKSLVSILSRVVEASVVYEKEPTRSPVGLLIRETLRGRYPTLASPHVLAHLFAADRLHHLYAPGGLLEKVAAGAIVVLDRYKYSSAAYQGGGWGESLYTPRDILSLVNALAPPANMVLYLDVEPEVAYERLRASRGVIEGPESPETLRRVREAYESVMRLLEEEPEWPTPNPPWLRGLETLGVEASCLYGQRAPIVARLDASKPREAVAYNAVRLVVKNLIEHGILEAVRH